MTPRWWLVAALYPFAAGAMALNLWMASLVLGWLGWPIVWPATATLAAIPAGLPPAWAYARHLTGLMARADAEAGA